MTLQMATANRLTDGAVVYLATDGEWTEHLYEGRIAATEAEAERLRQDAERDADRIVVGPYLIEIIEDDGKIWPARRREAIRALGPTMADLPGRAAERKDQHVRV